MSTSIANNNIYVHFKRIPISHQLFLNQVNFYKNVLYLVKLAHRYKDRQNQRTLIKHNTTGPRPKRRGKNIEWSIKSR